MTINDLLKIIPEENRDYFVKITIPQLREGDEGDFPLIEIMIDNKEKTIYLEADTY